MTPDGTPSPATGISRRRFLAMGAAAGSALLATACAPGAALPFAGTPVPANNAHDGAARLTPEALAPASGRTLPLMQLEAATSPVQVGRFRATTATYNGNYTGPVLRARPGDRMSLRLVNRLAEPTNLHFHGLHVSPSGISDNVFLTVDPGQSQEYVLDIPASHPAGTFWYHPHRHPIAAGQVFQGLAGVIIIEGDLDQAPGVAQARDLLMVLKDISLTAQGTVPQPTMNDLMNGREGPVVTVNGEQNPEIQARPGETVRLRLVNASPSRFYRLSLGGVPFHVVATDGGPLARTVQRDELLLPPGKRYEAVVQMPRDRNELVLLNLFFDRGFMGIGPVSRRSTAPAPLARFAISGQAMDAPLPGELPGRVPSLAGPVAATRRLVFTEQMGGMGGGGGGMGGGGMGAGGMGMTFMIDGKVFGHDRVDQRVRLGTTEEWVLVNQTDMDHPFHIHTNPFQVVARNGQPVEPFGWEDVVSLPSMATVTIRQRYETFTGLAVYHCHILDHEDQGMMGTILFEA